MSAVASTVPAEQRSRSRRPAVKSAFRADEIAPHWFGSKEKPPAGQVIEPDEREDAPAGGGSVFKTGKLVRTFEYCLRLGRSQTVFLFVLPLRNPTPQRFARLARTAAGVGALGGDAVGYGQFDEQAGSHGVCPFNSRGECRGNRPGSVVWASLFTMPWPWRLGRPGHLELV